MAQPNPNPDQNINLPIALPPPLTGINLNIPPPSLPDNNATPNDVYDAIWYRKAVEYAQGLPPVTSCWLLTFSAYTIQPTESRKQTSKAEVASTYLFETQVIHRCSGINSTTGRNDLQHTLKFYL